MSILLSEATHEQAMSYMKKILNNWKKDIVEVTFVKKSDKRIRRKMKVHFDEDFVKKATSGRFPEHVAKIKATNKDRDNMVVCELLSNGKYQFRTIPLRNVLRIRLLNKSGKTVQNSASPENQEVSESLVSEYDNNKFFVKVDPRIQKPGQRSGYEHINFNDPTTFSANTRGDCVIRALALATGLSYINVARKLKIPLDDKNDVPSVFHGCRWSDVFAYFHQTFKMSDARIFEEFLRTRLHKTRPSLRLTVKEFAQTISRHKDFKDKYLIVGCIDPKSVSGHAVFVKNGKYYDSWDSGDCIFVDVLDATNERRPTAYDFRNIVRRRRGIKTRFHENED